MKQIKLILVLMLVSKIAIAQESLTLFNAIELALKNNYAIQVAQNDRLQQINNNVAGNAGMLPTVQGNMLKDNTLTDTKQKFLNGSNNDKNAAKASQFNAGIELSWTVFDGFKMLASKTKLNSLEQAALYKFNLQVESTVSKVYKAYFDLVQAEQLYQLLQQTLAISEARQALSLSKYKIGKASKSEYLSSQVDCNTDKMQLLRQEVEVKNAKIALNQLLSRDLNSSFNAQFNYQPKAILNLDSLLTLAKVNNSSLSFLKASNKALRSASKEISAERYPSLMLKSGYNFSNTSSEAGFLQSSQNAGLHYGASIGFNFYNGGSLNRRLKNSQLQLKSAELSYKDSSLKIAQLIKQEYNKYELAFQLLNMENQNTEVAITNFDIAKTQFELGMYNAIEFRQAQLNLLQAQTRLLAVKNELELAEAELLKLVGSFAQKQN